MAGKNGAATEPHILTEAELDAILAADDTGRKTVVMPWWGKNVAVRIRGLSMDDIYRVRVVVDEEGAKGADRQKVRDREWLVAAVLEPKLTRARAERLLETSADPTLRLINEITALNGMTAEVAERLEGEFPAQPDAGA